jgi:hypothetical protein
MSWGVFPDGMTGFLQHVTVFVCVGNIWPPITLISQLNIAGHVLINYSSKLSVYSQILVWITKMYELINSVAQNHLAVSN